MRLALYARISPGGNAPQTTENQEPILRQYAKAHPENQYTDILKEVESSKKERPDKERVLAALREGRIDGVVVCWLDRWGRTLSELIRDFDQFVQKGWTFISLREAIDLSTSTGRMYANLLSVFANFERDRISERTREGLRRARAEGLILGRHPEGCGCGLPGHAGGILPIYKLTNDNNKEGKVIVGWQYPEGILPTNRYRQAKPGQQ